MGVKSLDKPGCILALETSSSVLSVALQSRRGNVRQAFFEGFLGHAENLMPLLDELLQKEKQRIQEVDTFLIGRGPGSFTGLRIGFATLKGFLVTQFRKCYGMLSFDSIAQPIRLEEGAFLSIVLDARRQMIYNQVYECRQRRWVAKSKPSALSLEVCLKKQRRGTYFAGDALERYRNSFEALPDAKVLSPALWYPKAAALLSLYQEPRVKRARTSPVLALKTPRDFLPYYLRLSEPEEKRRERARSRNKTGSRARQLD